MRYRKKADTVDAIHYIGVNEDQVLKFVGGGLPRYQGGGQLMIPMGGDVGIMMVPVGSWVVRHAISRYEVMDDETFTSVYESAEESW